MDDALQTNVFILDNTATEAENRTCYTNNSQCQNILCLFT